MFVHVYSWQATVFYKFSFFRMPSTEITERNSTKLCYMFRSKPDLKMDVQNLGVPFHKTWAQNFLFSGGFTTTYKRKYLQNETCYKWKTAA